MNFDTGVIRTSSDSIGAWARAAGAAASSAAATRPNVNASRIPPLLEQLPGDVGAIRDQHADALIDQPPHVRWSVHRPGPEQDAGLPPQGPAPPPLRAGAEAPRIRRPPREPPRSRAPRARAL